MGMFNDYNDGYADSYDEDDLLLERSSLTDYEIDFMTSTEYRKFRQDNEKRTQESEVALR